MGTLRSLISSNPFLVSPLRSLSVVRRIHRVCLCWNEGLKKWSPCRMYTLHGHSLPVTTQQGEWWGGGCILPLLAKNLNQSDYWDDEESRMRTQDLYCSVSSPPRPSQNKTILLANREVWRVWYDCFGEIARSMCFAEEGWLCIQDLLSFSRGLTNWWMNNATCERSYSLCSSEDDLAVYDLMLL